MQVRRILSIALIASSSFSMALASCSSPQTKPDPDVETTPTNTSTKAGPQCYAGCFMDSDGNCTTQGNVMDWSSSESETIPCDPSCCKPGAKTASGKVDSDGDGIPDDSDQCPNKKEDYDGYKDKDGCPDPDNDGDGIKDADDVCPLDAEDKDGFQDEDGCPDP